MKPARAWDIMQEMGPKQALDLQEETFEWIRRWWQAWAQKDLGALQQMVGHAYWEPTATRRFRPLPVNELMAEAAKCCQEVSISSWDIFDPVTKLYERMAVCSYSFRLAGTRGNRAFELTGRATDVLARDGDGFRLVSHHGTYDLATRT